MPVALALPPADPGFEMLISSQGMSQGLPQTDGIQIFPRLFVQTGPLQIGGQWRNVDSATANGVGAVYAKYSRPVGKAELDATVRYRIRTGHSGAGEGSAWEFSATGRGSFGNISVQASADYSPNEFGAGQSLFAEAGAAYAMSRTRISAAIGQRLRKQAPDYRSFNLGVGRRLGKALVLDGRFHMTDRRELGARFRERLVVSARIAL